jgi:hypothetical protein
MKPSSSHKSSKNAETIRLILLLIFVSIPTLCLGCVGSVIVLNTADYLCYFPIIEQVAYCSGRYAPDY